VKFRLTYQGSLRPTGNDPYNAPLDPLAAHKHRIRQCFHKQLKTLWNQNRFLANYKRHPQDKIDSRPISESAAYFGHDEKDKVLLIEYVASRFNEFNYRFVPLVCEEFSLLCSLEILFLRRDIPGSALQAGDIDNRVKTIIDALRKPNNAKELVGNQNPLSTEDPFFCLLQDDKLVSGFAVETDTLLDEVIPGDEDDKRRVHVVVSVELRPYFPTYFNLAFA
jgi:hypothetical protein